MSSTANEMTPVSSVLLKQHGHWLALFMARSENVYFLCTEQGLFTNTTVFFLVHTHNGQLEDCEEQFTEFAKMCMG